MLKRGWFELYGHQRERLRLQRGGRTNRRRRQNNTQSNGALYLHLPRLMLHDQLASHAAQRVDGARDGRGVPRRVGQQRGGTQRRERRRQLLRRAVRQVAALRQRLRQLLRGRGAPEQPAYDAVLAAQTRLPRACWWLSISAVLTTTSSGLAARSASNMLPAPAAL